MATREHAINWPLKFEYEEPRNWELPTYAQQTYLRSVMLYYIADNVSKGDIIINLWKTGYIELNEGYQVWRHPIFVYKNFCEILGYDWETKWDEDFEPTDWDGVIV